MPNGAPAQTTPALPPARPPSNLPIFLSLRLAPDDAAQAQCSHIPRTNRDPAPTHLPPTSQSLRRALDDAAKAQFSARRNPEDCAWLYLALGKKSELPAG